MMPAPLRVTIVGRDAALWLTAAALRQALAPTGISVAAVELPTRLGPASLYASLPPLEALHAKLGLEEMALLDAVGGSFSLGYNVVDAAAAPPPFFLAHGAYGAPIDGGDFFHHWAKARRFGLAVPLEHFNLTAMAARQARMMLPDEATAVFGRTDYAYHLPALAYAGALKTYACGLGLAARQARDALVERDPESGEIRAVRLDDGTRLEGDLFVDATGDGLLIGPAQASDPPAADRRLVARAAAFASVAPYSEIRIGEEGWAALHAAPAATYVVHGFASSEQGDDEAFAAAARLSGLALADAAVEAVPTGRRDAAWAGNCIAIGASARAFDPLFGLDLHAVQLGIVHLLSLFPATAEFGAERAEYNRITGSAFDRLADLPALFYATNRFAGNFWERARAVAPPAAVLHKIATFRARGEIPPMEDEIFAPDFWRALLVGFGEMPESWPPAIDLTPPDRMKQEFRRMLAFVRDKVLEQPTHDAYLHRLGRSEAA
jgi:tryptophan halogenase